MYFVFNQKSVLEKCRNYNICFFKMPVFGKEGGRIVRIKMQLEYHT